MAATVTVSSQKQIQRFRELQEIPYRLKIPYAIGKAQEFYETMEGKVLDYIGVKWENEYDPGPEQPCLWEKA